MNSLKRLKATLTASFDSLLDELENQEAVVDAGIKEIKEALVSISVQENSIQRELNNIQKTKNLIISNIETWKKRAKDVHESDRTKAKECARKVISLKEDLEQCSKI